jgi:asparaginyl-tRNA synthetase
MSASEERAVKQTYIEDVARHAGEEVTIKGWLYNIRSSGKLMFPQIRDGSGIIQGVVFKKNVPEQVWDDCAKLTQESSVVVTGTVRADERAPGGFELDVTGLEIVQIAEPYPITPKEHGTEFLLDNRHLWIRSKLQHAILRVRHEVVRATRDFFDGNGFILADTPIFTPNACEGTTNLFEVDYFGDDKAYLTQSGQLYNEATAAAFGRVYTFGPTFRAEKSKTRRHLTEFWMVEPEVAYATLDDVMDLAEGLLCFITERVLENRRRELEILERDISKLEAVKRPFPRISYDEAAKMLADGGVAFEYGGDFGAPDETYISSQFDRPVMVHRYPAAVKAFYMKPDPADPLKALGVDVLAPEGYGEVIGGGERATDLQFLEEQIAKHELPREAFDWYLDLRKFGSVPHGGFGMGIERCTAWMCGIEHIRETIPFPRTIYRLKP